MVIMNEEPHVSEGKLFGWANTLFSHSIIVVPRTIDAVRSTIKAAIHDGRKIIGRGAGHSYGDQALNRGEIVIDMSRMDHILEWDKVSGLLRVEAGANYDQILTCCLLDGWAPAVIPGTRYVTMGGALANNVHGKNSYVQRNFGEWVKEFKILLASGECYTCSKNINRDLFFAAIGGSGLLGVVIEMTIQLIRIPSAYLSVKKTTASSLSELLDQLDRASKKDGFVIAQVDCFPEGSKLGRGTMHTGNFISDNLCKDNLEMMRDISPRIFGIFPKQWVSLIGKYILNDFTMKWISRLKYHLDKNMNSEILYREDIFHFTFLFDLIPSWRYVFRHGFLEYEPLIPKEKARAVIPQLIALTHEYGMPAYLSAIKIHRADDFLLSYAMDGYSFALDIPRRPKEKVKQDELFRRMNEIVLDAYGIIYLAKDANLTSNEFRRMYPNLAQFLTVKEKYDPEALFQSDMYRRLFQGDTK